jgi:peptidyl-dipeptidase Dcp
MNPIIQPSPLKFGAIPFDKVKPEHFMPALETAIEKGRQAIKRIQAEPASFENSIEALESCSEELEFVHLLFSNLLSADTNDQLQKLSMEIGPKVASFANDILLDEQIFARIKTVHDQREKLNLKPEQKFLVEKVYRDFRRSGAELSPEKKNRLRAIDERLSQLSPKFRENTLRATNEFELWIDDEKGLAGLPESAREAAKESAKEKGQPAKWLFTLQAPSYLAFMRFSENRALREKMYRAFASRSFGGGNDNQPIILETVQLMTERAQLLGASNYAQWALETRMAETPEQVSGFLNKMLNVVKPAAEKDVREVQDLAAAMGGPNPMQPWDFTFYSEKLKQKKYSFDEEQLRPYFKLENVLKGVFELAYRLFGLKFTPATEYPVYHPDVQVYEVTRDNGEFVGLFYADFFPRASKNAGAWMTNYYEQGKFRGREIRPHVSNVCNFTKPTPGKPSLLTFDEVRTLFHEFGHGLHSLLSKVEFRSLAGTNVYLDFVELPSQILENWAEEEDLLKIYATHYQTGEVLPKEILKNLKDAQRFLAGYIALRQVNFAFLDLAWFTKPVGTMSVPEFEIAATERTNIFPRVEGTNISSSFGHIFGGGYASGYYSYKWAEALDADAYEYFKEKGIFDRETAKRFEECVLSKGGSDHPMRLYENFRGRKPDPEALLRRDGLIT